MPPAAFQNDVLDCEYANIMLDLECADASIDNPAIIQLGAVYFDLETGESLAELDIPINLDDCVVAGLKTSAKGIVWLENNIAKCLERSRTSKTSLQQALQQFNKFVAHAKVHTRLQRASEGRQVWPQAMVWGNGALADNLWIRSAYHACGMERPWMYYNDMCLRTFVNQIEHITGDKYSWNSFDKTGLPRHIDEPLHDALSDCKYQIRYLVAARGAILEMKAAATRVDKAPKPVVKSGRRRNTPAQTRRGLQTPETSFSGPQAPVEYPALPAIMTPNTSFSDLHHPEELAGITSTTSPS